MSFIFYHILKHKIEEVLIGMNDVSGLSPCTCRALVLRVTERESSGGQEPYTTRENFQIFSHRYSFDCRTRTRYSFGYPVPGDGTPSVRSIDAFYTHISLGLDLFGNGGIYYLHGGPC